MVTSEASRLKEHLRRVGEVKAAGHREATAAHLALAPGARFERGVQLSDSMLRLRRDAAPSGAPGATNDDEADTWARVNQHLRRLAGRSADPHG